TAIPPPAAPPHTENAAHTARAGAPLQAPRAERSARSATAPPTAASELAPARGLGRSREAKAAAVRARGRPAQAQQPPPPPPAPTRPAPTRQCLPPRAQ